MGAQERIQIGIGLIRKSCKKVFSQKTGTTEAFKIREKLPAKTRTAKPVLCSIGIHNKLLFCALAIALIALTLPTASAIPDTISVQGKLTNSEGTVLTGSYDFNFYLYDALTNGNLLWSEAHAITVNKGIFSATLGDTNTQTTFKDLDFNSDKWIAIELGGTMQTPRIKMASTGFAMRAQTANDLNSSGDVNAANMSVTGYYFGDGSKLTGIDTDINGQDLRLNNLSIDNNLGVTGDSNFTKIGVSGVSYLNQVNATGDSNFVNLRISGNSFLNALFATGDSNFNNIGFTGYIFGDGSKLTGITTDINGTSIAPNKIWATSDINTQKDINAQQITITKIKSNDANSANGTNAIALGSGTTAFGNQSTAMGLSTTASGAQSTAMGYYTTASGDYSTATGFVTTASGDTSTAIGYQTTASGNTSTTMGYYTTASGTASTAMGYYSRAAGAGAIAAGYGTANKGPFAIGDGSFAAGRSDTNMFAGDEAADKGAIALGYNARSYAEAAITLGKDLNNFNPNSVVLNDLNAMGKIRANSDLNISSGVNRGIGVAADANRICFPSNSCEMYIDYNGTAFIFGSG